jgi:hypothetical protein
MRPCLKNAAIDAILQVEKFIPYWHDLVPKPHFQIWLEKTKIDRVFTAFITPLTGEVYASGK